MMDEINMKRSMQKILTVYVPLWVPFVREILCAFTMLVGRLIVTAASR